MVAKYKSSPIETMWFTLRYRYGIRVNTYLQIVRACIIIVRSFWRNVCICFCFLYLWLWYRALPSYTLKQVIWTLQGFSLQKQHSKTMGKWCVYQMVPQNSCTRLICIRLSLQPTVVGCCNLFPEKKLFSSSCQQHVLSYHLI